MLDQITPVILTFNEEANIGRCLDQLSWADTVVVVDSGSIDRTEAICAQYKNVSFTRCPFEHHASQWTTAVEHPSVHTEWVLTLDADYILDDSFIQELESLDPGNTTTAYQSEFIYCINGHPLPHSLYPPRVVLARKNSLSFYLDGHTQRQKVKGEVEKLRSKLQHDDRKPESLWQLSQQKYAEREARKLVDSIASELSWSSLTRKYTAFSPYLITVYLGLYKGLWFAGVNGKLYIRQRVYFERLLQRELQKSRQSATH